MARVDMTAPAVLFVADSSVRPARSFMVTPVGGTGILTLTVYRNGSVTGDGQEYTTDQASGTPIVLRSSVGDKYLNITKIEAASSTSDGYVDANVIEFAPPGEPLSYA